MAQKQAIFRSDAYLAWVRTLPCANCGACAPSQAHHRIGHGRVSTMKTSDLEAMPLCVPCHTLLHNQGWVAFEMVNQCQLRMSLETIGTALSMGVIEVNRLVAEDLAR
jgi:hypothetical protein